VKPSGEDSSRAEAPGGAAQEAVEGEAAKEEGSGEQTQGAVAEDGQPKEGQADAPEDARERLSETVAFLAPDTTLNVMQSVQGNVLMTLNEGGLQYLLAGARANVGLKAGRYMFEARIVENLNQMEVSGNQARTPVPRNLLRVGVMLREGAPILGDNEDGVGFDSEGNFLFNRKRTPIAQRFSAENDVAVVLDLQDEGSPVPSTISLFKDGARASDPQPLPDCLKGKVLYPTVTFKNLTVHVHFGPKPHAPLPFRCRTVQDAAREDVVPHSYPAPKDGKHEVVFPVMLPEEGTFDWLDWFVRTNPRYTELSERAIVEWAMRSGLWRPKTTSFKTSLDRPDMNFGIPHLDDGSVKQILHMAATVQQRDFVVMEVRSNLLKQERVEALQRFKLPYFRRVGWVMMGEPCAEYKEYVRQQRLADKQAKSDAEFKSRKQERARKRIIEARQKQVEKARKKAERMKKRGEERKRKRQEAEARAAEAGEPIPPEEEDEDEMKDEEGEEEDEEKEEPIEETNKAEEEEEPPKVELTEAEKRDWFGKRLGVLPDVAGYLLGQSFSKFTLPEEADGFDEIRYDWSGPEGCVEHMKRWNLDRKVTMRIDDLQPSDWFRERWQEWQRDLQVWHMKHMEFKDPKKRAAILAAAAAAKAKEEAKAADKPGETAGKKDEKKEEPKDGNAPGAAEAKEEKTPSGRKSEETGRAETNGSEKGAAEGKEGGEKEQEGEKEVEKKKGEKEEEEKAEEEDPVKALVAEVVKHELDIFHLEEISDIGTGEPLYANFAFEDWALLSLRFELHLLVHAFRRDCNDPDRTGIHPDHLAFYYNKYYKKGLNPKNYGVESIEELVRMIRDTVVICRKIIESQITDDLEMNEVFVKLTEESRRDRQRRIDAGDQSVRLHFQTRPPTDPPPHGYGNMPGAGRTGIRPSAMGMSVQQQHQPPQHPAPPLAPQQVPPQHSPMQVPARPSIVQRPPVRMSGPPVGGRPYMSGRQQHQQQWPQQQHQPQGQWYTPRSAYGPRAPAQMPQRPMMRAGPYQQGWRYGR